MHHQRQRQVSHGLGINFNHAPPAGARQLYPYQLQAPQTESRAALSQQSAAPTECGQPWRQPPPGQRKVRIVSAANTYHDDGELSGTRGEAAGQPVSARLVDQPFASTSFSSSSGSDYGSHRASSMHNEEDNEAIYARYAAASSSANQAASQSLHLPHLQIDDLAAELQAAMPPKADAYSAEYPEAPFMHPRSYSVDDAYVAVDDDPAETANVILTTAAAVAYPSTAQEFSLPLFKRTMSEQPYAPPTNAPIVKVAPGLRRTGALSRPKSMLELGYLHTLQTLGLEAGKVGVTAPHSAQEARQRPVSHYLDAVGIPAPHAMSREGSSAFSTSPTSPCSVTTTDSAMSRSTTATSSHSDYAYTKAGDATSQPIRSRTNSRQSPMSAVSSPRSIIKAKSALSLRPPIIATSSDQSYVGQLRSPQMLHVRSATAPSDDRQHGTPPRSRVAHKLAGASALNRQSTLLTANGASPAKHARELGRILDPKAALNKVDQAHSPVMNVWHSSEIPAQPVFQTNFDPVDAIGPSGHIGQQTSLVRKPSAVAFEQMANKNKARVELDLSLATEVAVEGGILKGRIDVTVRKAKDTHSEVWLGPVKTRIIGFEELTGEDARHVFYHHSASMDSELGEEIKARLLPCYDSQPDEEGFFKGKAGLHSFAFSMALPRGKGAKGCLKSKQGVVKYIVIGSIKLKARNGTNRSIAHFYRHIELYPYFQPSALLAPSPKPFFANVSKPLFGAANGAVNLQASLHRETWVAGQRCYVNVIINNQANKKVKFLSLTLTRTQTIFRPTSTEEANPVPAQVIRKKVVESTLEMGKRAAKGGVTAKGVWLGVEPDEIVDFCHPVTIPGEELTIDKGQLLAVSYKLKVALGGSAAAELAVELPLRIVSFISIDPPPGNQPVASDPPKLEDTSRDQTKALPAGSLAFSMREDTDTFGLMQLNRPYDNDMSTHQHTAVRNGVVMRPGGMTRTSTMPELCQAQQMPVYALAPIQMERATSARDLRHQMSLDCIGSAIASATARRASQIRPLSDIYENVNEADDDKHYTQGVMQHDMRYTSVQLDDLDDIPEDDDFCEDYGVYGIHQPMSAEIVSPMEYASTPSLTQCNEDSDDEVEAVLQLKHYESVDSRPDTAGAAVAFGKAVPHSPAQSRHPASRDRHATSPVRGSMASPTLVRDSSRPARRMSPVMIKASITPDVASMIDGRISTSAGTAFALATPASPIKKGRASVLGIHVQGRSTPRRSTSHAASSALKATFNENAAVRNRMSSVDAVQTASPGRITRATIRKHASTSTLRTNIV